MNITGSYWHSINPHTKSKVGINKYRHRDKQDYFNRIGIKLYYLWEYWSIDKCKNIIQAKLNRTKKLYGPKLQLISILPKERREFFDRIHVDGDCRAEYTIGLTYRGRLISCMSFRPNAAGLEIARLATEPGFSVIEGPSILIKKGIEYAKQNSYSSIISYCLRDLAPISNNSVYSKLGFELLGDSGPTMKYYNKKDEIVYPRQRYQKFKLQQLFPDTWDPAKTETDLLYINKIYPIYDSGNWKYRLPLERSTNEI